MAATQVVIGTNAWTADRPSGRFSTLAAVWAVAIALGAIIIPLIPETIWNGLKTVVMGLAAIGAMWLSVLTAPLQ